MTVADEAPREPLTELTAERAINLTGLRASATEGRLAGCVAAANAYVARYRVDTPWGADTELGAARIAAGLYRDGYTPAVGEGWEQQGSVWARVTDVEIEQLLRIGRFAPPRVG